MREEIEVFPLGLRHEKKKQESEKKEEEVIDRTRITRNNKVPQIPLHKKIWDAIGEFLNCEIKVIKDPERPWSDWKVILVRPIREEEDKK